MSGIIKTIISQIRSDYNISNKSYLSGGDWFSNHRIWNIIRSNAKILGPIMRSSSHGICTIDRISKIHYVCNRESWICHWVKMIPSIIDIVRETSKRLLDCRPSHIVCRDFQFEIVQSPLSWIYKLDHYGFDVVESSHVHHYPQWGSAGSESTEIPCGTISICYDRKSSSCWRVI